MSVDSDDFGLQLGPTYEYGGPALSPPSPVLRALTIAGAFAVGVLLVVVIIATRDAARMQDLRRADLIDLIGAREQRIDALTTRLEELRAELAAAEDAAAAGAPAAPSDLDELAAQAGLTPLDGPGVRVTLADAGASCASTVPEDCRILDTDIQLGVNTLFGAGAEAVAVNGERVIATTAVRSAGGTILVNYRPLTSPYTIEAIGDPTALQRQLAESTFGRDFALWREQFGLGYQVGPQQQLRLPAYHGGVQLNATPMTRGAR